MPLTDDPLPKLFALFILLAVVISFSKVDSQTEPTEPTENTIHQYDISPFSYPKYQVLASVSAYNPIEEQTDSTPFINASGDRVKTGDIACPSWLELGTIVAIDDEIYICKDRMGKERIHGNYFDIFMWELKDAIEYGRKTKEVIIYD